MKKLSTIFMSLLVLLSSSVFAITAEEREANAARQRTDIFVSVVNLNKNEQEKIYQILLSKEKQSTAVRNKHKGDKDTIRASIKPLNRTSNRQIKDIIGRERMGKMNDYFKAQRAAKKK